MVVEGVGGGGTRSIGSGSSGGDVEGIAARAEGDGIMFEGIGDSPGCGGAGADVTGMPAVEADSRGKCVSANAAASRTFCFLS